MGKRNFQRALKDLDIVPSGSTLLDVGCGRGEVVREALGRGIDAWGLEIVPELVTDRVTQGSITDIHSEPMEYVCCYDVLEHLAPSDVPRALDELWRVATKALFITTNDNRAQRKGIELHLTRKPREWWEAEFEKRGYSRIEGCVFKTERDWHWRIDVK